MLSQLAVVSRPPMPSPSRPSPDTYGGLPNGLIGALPGPMSRSQASLLKSLAIEAYQPKLFERDLTREEAARRIEALKQEIALANSF